MGCYSVVTSDTMLRKGSALLQLKLLLLLLLTLEKLDLKQIGKQEEIIKSHN